MPDEIPEADALEQATTATPSSLAAAPPEPSVPVEANEADAAEQLVEVEFDDDYDR
jgi:hypothetical protein